MSLRFLAFLIVLPFLAAPARAAEPAGNAARCLRLVGDEARDCYRLEVGRQLAAVRGADPADFAAPATITWAKQGPDLLCDLHARAGVVQGDVPSWVSWNEPLISS
jgi:hypothetical protein